MLLIATAQILPMILGEDSGVICGQTNGELSSQLHSRKPGELCVQGREVFQLVQSTVPAEDGSSVSESNSCKQTCILWIKYPKSDFYSL